LNENLEGDLRDTSTPESMAESLQKIALGNVLEEKQRALLQTWLKANTTGKERIRSSVPQDWVVGDKTGTGQRSSADLAILWPHNGSPWILAVYFESENASPTEKSRVIAEAAKRVLNDRKD
jgi:beta-lactamase class A